MSRLLFDAAEAILVSVDAIASAEAFGTPVVAGPVTVTGIASAEAFGTPTMAYVISPTGIASAEAFGSPTVTAGVLIFVAGIPTGEAFGAVAITGPISLVGIPSEEAFGFPHIKAFGALAVIGDATSPLEGGVPVTLHGAVVDMTTCQDDFSDGVLDAALWTAVTVGDGSVNEIGSARLVKLDTGMTAGSSAAIRSVETVTGVDVEVTITPDLIVLPTGTARAASLALRVSATTEFRLDLEVTQTATTLRVLQRVNGQTSVDQAMTVGGGVLPGPITLRILRYGGRVLARLNDIEVADAVFVGDAAAFEFLVSNDATNDSRVRSNITWFNRNPAVVFGETLAPAFILKTEGTVIVSAPAHELPDTVTVTVYGCDFSDTVVDGFEYLLGNRKAFGRSSTQSLVVLNDARLKET
ncbi:hypothetical protein Rctr197k_090 [Virus Rctr197k]|nr:hypothetical protein Rctr197k_090 [Virus Rctr197k]